MSCATESPGVGKTHRIHDADSTEGIGLRHQIEKSRHGRWIHRGHHVVDREGRHDADSALHHGARHHAQTGGKRRGAEAGIGTHGEGIESRTLRGKGIETAATGGKLAEGVETGAAGTVGIGAVAGGEQAEGIETGATSAVGIRAIAGGKQTEGIEATAARCVARRRAPRWLVPGQRKSIALGRPGGS